MYQYQVTRPWYGLIILENRSYDLGSELPYQGFFEHQVKRLYLEDLLGLNDLDLSPNLAFLKLFVAKGSAIVPLAQSILSQVKSS